MRVKLTIIGALFLSLICTTGAFAQYSGYTIQTPGQLPTYVNPTPNGGYTMQRPGQLPTYANPTPNGGYTMQTPGQLPTYINPR